MSQYTYQTCHDGSNATVVAGFDARSAAFFGMLFKGDLMVDPDRETEPQPTPNALIMNLERWGLRVPAALECALDSDVSDWELSPDAIKKLGRKFEDFGFVEPHPPQVIVRKKASQRTPKQNKK